MAEALSEAKFAWSPNQWLAFPIPGTFLNQTRDHRLWALYIAVVWSVEWEVQDMSKPQKEAPKVRCAALTTKQLAERTGMSPASVRKYMRILVDSGWVERFEQFREDGGQMANRYSAKH